MRLQMKPLLRSRTRRLASKLFRSLKLQRLRRVKRNAVRRGRSTQRKTRPASRRIRPKRQCILLTNRIGGRRLLMLALLVMLLAGGAAVAWQQVRAMLYENPR